MEYRNEYDKDGVDIDDGKRAEANFVRIFTKRFGVAPIKTSAYVDKHDHIDFYINVGKRRSSVDVKSWKKDPNYIWIEFISYGKLGWLYGKAEYIAFERPDEQGFIVVKRQKLRELVKRCCVVDFTDIKNESLFRPYVRIKGKDNELYDCVTRIPREYLDETNPWILE